MTFSVRYVPGDQTINLHQATAADLALIAALHEGRPWREDRHVFQCLETGGDPDMLIRLSPLGRYHFAHFGGGAHGSHEVVPETDTHKRMKEYPARAVESAGLTAIQEFPVKGGKLDVAITGGAVAVDIEAQHSEHTSSYFKRRTAIYHRAGYLTAWFSDLGAVPGWLSGVPAFGCNAQPWAERLPAPRSVTATGLTLIEAVKCVVGAFYRCPAGQRRPCGRYHAKRVPWRGLTVDDVAVRLPAGEIVPLADGNLSCLTSPGSAALYQELASDSRWMPRGNQAVRPSQPGPGPCTNSGHEQAEREAQEALTRARMARLAQERRAHERFRCDTCGGMHPLIEHRACRARAALSEGR